MGSKNRRTYRVVAIEEGKRRNGRALEILGHYNPLIHPPKLTLKADRIDYWRSVGAQLTPSVHKLISEHS